MKLFLFFILLTLLAPLAIGFGIFGELMTIEGTALPWFGFLVVPFIYFGVLLPQAFKTGRQIHRLAAQHNGGGVH